MQYAKPPHNTTVSSKFVLFQIVIPKLLCTNLSHFLKWRWNLSVSKMIGQLRV